MGVGRALTQPQQEKQEGGQHYPVVLSDQRVLSPAGWQQSKKSVDMVTGGPPPPCTLLPGGPRGSSRRRPVWGQGPLVVGSGQSLTCSTHCRSAECCC